MSFWNPSQWFSPLFGSATTPTETLVGAREGPLATNAQQIDKIAQTTEALKQLHAKLQKDNPTLFQSFTTQEPTVWEMAEHLKIVVLASASDLSELSQDLDAIRDTREKLEELVETWEKIEKNFDRAIEAGLKSQTVDLQNVEDLSALIRSIQKLGIQNHCHSRLL